MPRLHPLLANEQFLRMAVLHKRHRAQQASPSARTAPFRPLPADPLAWLMQAFAPYFHNAQGLPIPLAPHHETFWEWLWSLRPGLAAPTFIGIWARGGGKSTNTELGAATVGYFGLRRYALYISSSQSQADDHVANVGAALERLGVERALNKYGYSRGWRVNGSSTLNRGHEHQRLIRRCNAREGRPRCCGGTQRGSGT